MCRCINSLILNRAWRAVTLRTLRVTKGRKPNFRVVSPRWKRDRSRIALIRVRNQSGTLNSAFVECLGRAISGTQSSVTLVGLYDGNSGMFNSEKKGKKVYFLFRRHIVSSFSEFLPRWGRGKTTHVTYSEMNSISRDWIHRFNVARVQCRILIRISHFGV